MNLTLEHDLFKIIRHEHAEILKLAKNYAETQEGLDLLIHKITEHHQKEDCLLFKKIDTYPRLCEGGPQCAYFFDEQVTSPPLKTAQQLTGSEPKIPEHLKKIWDKNSPLRIPIGEHHAIQHILDTFSLSPANSLESIRKTLYLIHRNIQKEEQCFAHVCLKFLNKDDADTLFKEWLQN